MIEHSSAWQPADAVRGGDGAAGSPVRNSLAARLVRRLVGWCRTRARAQAEAFADDGAWHW